MNKAAIRTQFLALLNRNDCTNAIADTFIDQAVSRIQRTLRVPAMEKQSVNTVNTIAPEAIVLPDDFLNIKYLYSDFGMMEYRDFATFMRYTQTVGQPYYYTRVQGELKMRPTPPEGTEITMVYYGEIPDLVSDTDINFLTIIAPDLLIYGALTFAADFFVDERKQIFEDRFAAIYGEVEEQSRLVDMDQATLAMAPAYYYPD
jgi:hypothetical protein